MCIKLKKKIVKEINPKLFEQNQKPTKINEKINILAPQKKNNNNKIKNNKRKRKERKLHVQQKSKNKKTNTLASNKERKKIEGKKKEKKKKGSQHVTGKEKIKGKKEKRSRHARNLEVNSNMKGIFRSSFHELSPLSFLSIFGRKLFGGPEEKTFRPHHLFSFLFTQPNTLQKSFPSYYLSKVFHPPYFTFKQTHPKCLSFISSPHVVASLNNFN